MTKNKARALLILGLTTVLTACGQKTAADVISKKQDYNGYGLAGKKYRQDYNVLTVSSIGSLNYLTTQESANAQHFANFIDGLLLHNDFGVLEKNLATEVKHDASFKKFQLKIREGVAWQRYDGSQYVNSAGEAQFVKAQDWVDSALAICTYANGSDLQYLIGTFVKGTTEYYCYMPS